MPKMVVALKDHFPKQKEGFASSQCENCSFSLKSGSRVGAMYKSNALITDVYKLKIFGQKSCVSICKKSSSIIYGNRKISFKNLLNNSYCHIVCNINYRLKYFVIKKLKLKILLLVNYENDLEINCNNYCLNIEVIPNVVRNIIAGNKVMDLKQLVITNIENIDKKNIKVKYIMNKRRNTK